MPSRSVPVMRLPGTAIGQYVCRQYPLQGVTVRSYSAVVERDTETGLLVGHIPGFRGAHSQATTMEELEANLAEVVAMLLEDGEPKLEAEFVGYTSEEVLEA